MARPLTEKQRRFVEAFMGEANGNATEAARLAGYAGNDDTLRVVASENLAKPNIAEAVKERANASPLIATREERQRFWTSVMRGEMGFEPRDVLKASELLGKSQRDFIDRVEHSGPDGKPIETRKVDPKDLTDEQLAAVVAEAIKGK